MKKISHCMFPLLGLVSSVLFVISVPAFGQTPVTQSSEQEVVEEVDWEELEPEVPSLSQEEFDAQFSNWENLGKTSLQQYLDSFDLFLETSLPQYDMQPYVLAECLWFQVAVLPKFQQMKQDGSLDVLMEMNMTMLPDIEKKVADFFAQLGEGKLPLHPWSDTVFAIFRRLSRDFSASNEIIILSQIPFMLDEANLPNLPSVMIEQVFMPVDISFRNVQLYRGLMDLEYLVEQFNAAESQGSSKETEGTASAEGTSEVVSKTDGAPDAEPDAESAFQEAEAVVTEASELVLLPQIPGIDWEQVVLNQPLMYLLAHSTAGKDIYSVLRTYHSGQTHASRCEELYQECSKIGVQWGFDLEQILPNFSATGIGAAKKDAFILYCLPEHDLDQIFMDLSCLKVIAPVYYSRAVAQLQYTTSHGGSL